jgi:predicted DNA-binding protein (MmcQ/YjbR family)
MPADPFKRPVYARARRLCLSLPETTERVSWGHPNFRAGRRVFCAFEVWKSRPSIAFRLSRTEAARAVRGRRFFATPYGRGVWVSLWIDGKVNWNAVESMIERSYRTVAAAKLVRLLDARTGGARRR